MSLRLTSLVSAAAESAIACKGTGVSHSLGRARSRNGMQELTYASRLIQLGSSLPHSSCSEMELYIVI